MELKCGENLYMRLLASYSILTLLPSFTVTRMIKPKEAVGNCPAQWTGSGGSCYRVLTFDQPSEVTQPEKVAPSADRGWTHARLSCMVMGSDLVSINSDREAHQIDNIRRKAGVDDSHYYWIGLHDAPSPGNFRWVDGSNVTFSRWKVGEPTSAMPQNHRGRKENYVLAHGGADWMDVENTWRRYTSCLEPYAYICEKPLKSESTNENEVSRRVTRVLGLAGATGPKGDMGPQGVSGSPGTSGPPGQQGYRGPAGQPGTDGHKGDRGDPGRDGTPGQKGSHGPPGMIQVMDTLIGPDGAEGPQGPKGDQGPRGPTGRDGQKGDKGFTGPLGPAGPMGPKGDIGDTGRPGAQGSRGFTGQTGQTGTQGLSGRPGMRGPIGLTGPKGSTGEKGDLGVPGLTGKEGQTGATGRRGQRGPMGVQGLTGSSGPKGERGVKGKTGGEGGPGPSGPKGDTGEPGLPGLNGVPGIPGAMGPEGPPGPFGDPGRDGQNGIPGMPGMDGVPGPKGDRGSSGSRGEVGPPGPPGAVPANAAVQGPSTYNKGSGAQKWRGKTVFVNATAFCMGRAAAAFGHPLHCWQFITCGAIYGGDMEHTCYAGRRFDIHGPECKKDVTCVFGAPSATNEEWTENRRMAALALKEGGTHFAQRSAVKKIRATHSVYSAGMVVIFVLIAALAAMVCKLQLSHRHRNLLPPLVIEKPGSVV